MKSLYFVVDNQDVLSEEMGNIIGGNNEKETPIIHCNSDGVVHIEPTELAMNVI